MGSIRRKRKTKTRDDGVRITERPDGFYWHSVEAAGEHGPFATLLEASEDVYGPEAAEETIEVGESVEEAEEELGICGWKDSDTGELAEDSPHHIEDH